MSLNIGISAYGGVSATVSAAIVIPGVVVNNPVVPMRRPYKSECPRPWMLCAPANVALLLSPSAITAVRYALLKPQAPKIAQRRKRRYNSRSDKTSPSWVALLQFWCSSQIVFNALTEKYTYALPHHKKY